MFFLSCDVRVERVFEDIQTSIRDTSIYDGFQLNKLPLVIQKLTALMGVLVSLSLHNPDMQWILNITNCTVLLSNAVLGGLHSFVQFTYYSFFFLRFHSYSEPTGGDSLHQPLYQSFHSMHIILASLSHQSSLLVNGFIVHVLQVDLNYVHYVCNIFIIYVFLWGFYFTYFSFIWLLL